MTKDEFNICERHDLLKRKDGEIKSKEEWLQHYLSSDEFDARMDSLSDLLMQLTLVDGEYIIYNPHNKNINDLPTIFGFNDGGRPGMLYGLIISEDGHVLGSHLCSSEKFMYRDLGIIKGWQDERHKEFKKHYPDGYRMDFVSYCDIENHEKLQNAIKLNNQHREGKNV